jgi:hypothetical protein
MRLKAPPVAVPTNDSPSSGNDRAPGTVSNVVDRPTPAHNPVDPMTTTTRPLEHVTIPEQTTSSVGSNSNPVPVHVARKAGSRRSTRIKTPVPEVPVEVVPPPARKTGKRRVLDTVPEVDLEIVPEEPMQKRTRRRLN